MNKSVGCHTKKYGFTITELLIVIVVLGILASFTAIAYNGVKNRALDSRRISDMSAIIKALEMYKTQTGRYPSVSYVGSGSMSGWESSAHESPGEFIKPIASGEYGLARGTPIDPVNNATSLHSYLYYRYGAGSYGCDSSRGAYFVVGIKRTNTYGASAHPENPRFSCASRDWSTEFSWVTGRFEN